MMRRFSVVFFLMVVAAAMLLPGSAFAQKSEIYVWACQYNSLPL
jgi:hypothetical protein